MITIILQNLQKETRRSICPNFESTMLIDVPLIFLILISSFNPVRSGTGILISAQCNMAAVFIQFMSV